MSSFNGTTQAAIGLALLTLPGCGMATMVETNTRAIEGTTGAIHATGAVIAESNRNLVNAQKSMERLDTLREPMERVAGLEKALVNLGELKTPMEDLHRSVAEMAELKRSLAELRALSAGMKSVAELKEPMESVASLDKSMRLVADLRDPMERVAVLHQPLEEVSKLSPPMTQMAKMSQSASRRLDLLVGGLLGWGLVTFLAVYFGVQAGSRRMAAREREAEKPARTRVSTPAPEAP